MILALVLPAIKIVVAAAAVVVVVIVLIVAYTLCILVS